MNGGVAKSTARLTAERQLAECGVTYIEFGAQRTRAAAEGIGYNIATQWGTRAHARVVANNMVRVEIPLLVTAHAIREGL